MCLSVDILLSKRSTHVQPHVLLVYVRARLAAADSRMKEEMAGFLLEISTKQQQLAAVEERQRGAEQQRQV